MTTGKEWTDKWLPGRQWSCLSHLVFLLFMLLAISSATMLWNLYQEMFAHSTIVTLSWRLLVNWDLNMICCVWDWFKVVSVVFFTLKWSCSVVSDSATKWTVAYQAPPSMGFSRQEYWGGLPLLSQGISLTRESNPHLPHCGQTLYHLSHQLSIKVIKFYFAY